jgi:hypothetical protein
VDDANYDTYNAANVWKEFKLVRKSGLWAITFDGHNIDKATIKVLNATTDEELDKTQIADGTIVKFEITPEEGYINKQNPAAMQIHEDTYIAIDVYARTYRIRVGAKKLKGNNNEDIEAGKIVFTKSGIAIDPDEVDVYGYATIICQYGDYIGIEAVPNAGYIFKSWTDVSGAYPTRSISCVGIYNEGQYIVDDYTYRYSFHSLTAEFEVDPATGVDNTAAERNAVKRIVNGQLLIEREGKTYNALGAEVK